MFAHGFIVCFQPKVLSFQEICRYYICFYVNMRRNINKCLRSLSMQSLNVEFYQNEYSPTGI